MTDRTGCQPFIDELLEEKGLSQHFWIVKFKAAFNWTVLWQLKMFFNFFRIMREA